MEDAKSEKTISNYRIWIDYVFNQQNYWIEPTEEERKLFDELRVKSSEQEKSLFESYSKGSPKPTINLVQEFEMAVLDELSKEPFQATFFGFLNGLLPKDLKTLAVIIGKLDFIKATKLPKEKKFSVHLKALLYWLELKVSGKEPPKDFEGNFIKSEIEKIGAYKCNNKGHYFYKIFKDIDIDNQKNLTKTFGKDWKEDIKKLSNYNIKIIEYIEKNYS
jgi:hypothetical protein